MWVGSTISIELARFPMVYTRLLTLNNLAAAEYYLYLLLYNIVYILPLLLIMALFVVTMGQRKLQEHEGRVLKLLSGLMMLTLAHFVSWAALRHKIEQWLSIEANKERKCLFQAPVLYPGLADRTLMPGRHRRSIQQTAFFRSCYAMSSFPGG